MTDPKVVPMNPKQPQGYSAGKEDGSPSILRSILIGVAIAGGAAVATRLLDRHVFGGKQRDEALLRRIDRLEAAQHSDTPRPALPPGTERVVLRLPGPKVERQQMNDEFWERLAGEPEYGD